MSKILSYCVYCILLFTFSGCFFLFQNNTTSYENKNYGIKYSYVQTKEFFDEEVKQLVSNLENSGETYLGDFINSINELRFISPQYNLGNFHVTIKCTGIKNFTKNIQDLLFERVNPCNDAGIITPKIPNTTMPYQFYFGKRYENIQNKEQFLAQYTTRYNHIQTINEVQDEIDTLYMQIDYGNNALFDLQELKHYAFKKGIITSYHDFYNMT
ncbi:hypothetical protein CQA53_04305 [Helicobacter didelphidarum]|uniref:Lipoprotein n=1 Tax=Helicobacter didelphidarum TaxID=2040648 RepID=A0A3D8IMM0_9HELI|nr:hypothetical protein [Helicobacter didelphidarum]RDU66240.1 hypothetical protein CQA53_04305 [Helicobacter didelphidarum]